MMKFFEICVQLILSQRPEIITFSEYYKEAAKEIIQMKKGH